VRAALKRGEIDAEDAKEGMRFGAGAAHAASQGSGRTVGKGAGSRAHIGWFGITVASFERGDIRQSPNGVYIYDDTGRRELEVVGGRGTGMLEMKELYEALTEGKPIVHDGRWAMATLEVGNAILQSARERREVMLTHQCGLAGCGQSPA
jgi:predicted dehydrogenase